MYLNIRLCYIYTVSRTALVGNVTAMLEDADFLVSERCAIRPKSFDVAARRGEDVLLVKILGNVDAFTARTGAEMRRLGEHLGATPLVLGLRTRDQELERGVVYFRQGVPVFSPDTALDLFVENVPPLVYAAPGGLYVNIDGEVLADAREQRGWSLGRLAKELGVSRRTVSKYEDGMDASVEVAAQLSELFDEPLTAPVDVFDEPVKEVEDPPEGPEPDPDEPVVAVLTRVGYEVYATDRAPFETVSDDEHEQLLTGHSEFTEAAEKRARIMSSVAYVTRSRPVYVVENAPRESVERTAIVEQSEMEGIEEREEFRDLISDRGEERPA